MRVSRALKTSASISWYRAARRFILSSSDCALYSAASASLWFWPCSFACLSCNCKVSRLLVSKSSRTSSTFLLLTLMLLYAASHCCSGKMTSSVRRCFISSPALAMASWLTATPTIRSSGSTGATPAPVSSKARGRRAARTERMVLRAASTLVINPPSSLCSSFRCLAKAFVSSIMARLRALLVGRQSLVLPELMFSCCFNFSPNLLKEDGMLPVVS
mmetsp:Transcript_4633/g.12664  ORF Transcript_4633/g.12664 Transcript_4633/m.12664 type:complete len:217 (+) Transcript_4633:1567-2217(+)